MMATRTFFNRAFNCFLFCFFLGHGVASGQSVWGNFGDAVPVGSGVPTTTQTLAASVSGSGRGAGIATLTFNVSGGVSAWNGFGVGSNDDGYFSAPNLPQLGITFVNGAPGYNGGIPAVAAASFATAYNAAAAPAGTPTPTDRAAIYFDAGDGTTVDIAWNFSTLHGGRLLAGSWIFLDGVDQGERVTVTGPSGWIGAITIGDSTLPRPPQSGLPPTVSAPTFPLCSPAISSTSTTLQLDGRYGDLSNLAPSCANTPVPVPGVTVGYTKGMDSVGVWVRTAIDVSTLTLSASDLDLSPRNPQTGAYVGPDNNFVLGVGFIAATESIAVPGPNALLLLLLASLLGAVAWRARLNTQSDKRFEARV
jgi:hypothetical protein